MSKNQKIIFKETYEVASSLGPQYSPSIKHIPEWFKSTKPFSNGETDYLEAKKNPPFEGTMKLCMPVLDGLTSGYMMALPASIIVSQIGGMPRVEWGTHWDPLDSIPTVSLGEYPIPHGHSGLVFRWNTLYRTITPSGYSTLISHPIHRHDLPFFTLTGVVDTDTTPNKIVVPFVIREGFEGVIEEGTPIAQLLPFKRENWNSSIAPYTPDEAFGHEKIKKSLIRTYKKKYWSKKQYN